MLRSLAIANYRSLRDLILPLAPLNVVTGGNGTGKSNLYRGLRLLSETATGTAVESIAKEGGIESALWAGPEQFSRLVKSGRHPVQGGPRKDVVKLRFGFVGDDFGYAIDFGLPTPVPGTMFVKDPEIKREVIWHGELWHDRRAVADRRGGVVRTRDDKGAWRVVAQHLPTYDSMLTSVADPLHAPEVMMLREQIRSWRFYDHFRSDIAAPARMPQVGARTPVLSNDGSDLAAAWRTIMEVGDDEALDAAVGDAFPGASVDVENIGGRFSLRFSQHGLLRPLTQAELSDGTLRYLLWIAALLTPRPPSLMVLNEPETSLHPELLPALGRLMCKCAEDTQLWVTTHAPSLIEALAGDAACNHIVLDKDFGETVPVNVDSLDVPAWRWPAR